MSIPKPELLSLSPVDAGLLSAASQAESADTSLIATLANELYRGASGGGLPALRIPPEAPAGTPYLPPHPQVPGHTRAAGAPASAVQPAGDTVALAGGFPATTSSASVPPVHPSVVDAEPESEAPAKANPDGRALRQDVPTGTHARGERDGYEFGEPYFYTERQPDGKQADAASATGLPPQSAEPYGSGGSPQQLETGGGIVRSSLQETQPADSAQYYFLQQPKAQATALSSAAGYAGGGLLDGVQPAASAASPAGVWAGAPAGNGVSAQAGSLSGSPLSAFDVEAVRRDFPALQQYVNGRPLVWLDNAATTHKPQAVIDATSRFYARDNSNIHRAAHALAARSTDLFEAGRESVRRFLGAADTKEIVFVRGTTEAINLVAQSYGRSHIGEGDEILLTELEHHANIVPWQILASQVGAVLRVIPINDRGELVLEKVPELITARTKIVSVAHVSNSLGTINPVQEIIALAHSRGVPVLVDGAQSTPHIPINVQALDADFYVFSGHKIFAPTGIGALYAKRHWLETLPAWQGGGHMIKDVTFEKTVFNGAPEKFEAGTPDIAGVVGLGAAIEYLFRIGIPALSAYEHSLLEYGTEALKRVKGLRPVGTAANKASVLSFVIPGYDNVQIARYLDERGIAVRAGHHCAQPAIRHFGLESSVRPSLAFYNTFAEIDTLVAALRSLTR